MAGLSSYAAMAEASNLIDRVLPSFTTSYRFEVHIGTFDLGSWTKCDGLQIDYQVSQYQTAMCPDENNMLTPRIWNYLSRPTFKPITLTRPCHADGLLMTSFWLEQMWEMPTPEFALIIMFDS